VGGGPKPGRNSFSEELGGAPSAREDIRGGIWLELDLHSSRSLEAKLYADAHPEFEPLMKTREPSNGTPDRQTARMIVAILRASATLASAGLMPRAMNAS